VSPGGSELCWRACVGAAAFLPSAPELVSEVHHGAKKCGTVIVQQFDKAGFLDEAAEFDELSRSCPAFLGSITGIVQGLGAGDEVLHDLDAAKLRRCCLQVPE
jgi:hypothetical protein